MGQSQGIEKLRQYRNDFIYYAAHNLKIRTKSGEIAPLILNGAQLFVHHNLERQKKRTGKVRALILKGRQQGISTYIGGREYHRTSGNFGQKTLILAHLQEASDNLFDMVKRYHDNCHPALKPHTKAANAKELYFNKLDSMYKVSTAGSKETGRSDTIQNAHGSEVAFWTNAKEHMAGMKQAIPDEPGTEILLESTANGIGGLFHKMWVRAERGEGEYVAIFVPWFWQEEYKKDATGFVLEPEEVELQEIYGLSIEQLAWRRNKIMDDFSGDVTLFKQEYPCTASEAFQSIGKNPYIKPELIARARTMQGLPEVGPLIMGVDPARFGDDYFVILLRRGRVVKHIEKYAKCDAMEGVGRVSMAIDRFKPQMTFIDIGGMPGVYDRLKELGYGTDVLAPVNFGEKSTEPELWPNMRGQMWGKMKDWFEDPPVSIPDSDSLQTDLVSVRRKRYDSLQRPVLYTKEEMRSEDLESPDEGDALALTFAYPVKTKKKSTIVSRRGMGDRAAGLY